MQPTTSHADHVPQRQTTIFDATVASRIEALLARCDRLTTAKDMHVFDARGEAHARSVAERDQENNRG